MVSDAKPVLALEVCGITYLTCPSLLKFFEIFHGHCHHGCSCVYHCKCCVLIMLKSSVVLLKNFSIVCEASKIKSPPLVCHDWELIHVSDKLALIITSEHHIRLLSYVNVIVVSQTKRQEGSVYQSLLDSVMHVRRAIFSRGTKSQDPIDTCIQACFMGDGHKLKVLETSRVNFAFVRLGAQANIIIVNNALKRRASILLIYFLSARRAGFGLGRFIRLGFAGIT